MTATRFLTGYPQPLLDKVEPLIHDNRIEAIIAKRYPQPHQIKTDNALYQYTKALKDRYLKQSAPLAKAVFDPKIHIVNHALGTHTYRARVQGKKLKVQNEIRIARLFRDLPEPFLRMIVVHELAHIKEKQHDKAFYKLCQYMEPDYHQLEFDLRLLLCQLEWNKQSGR
ncbi:M48 family metallopeptidase [Ferrimonas aestuarii]|uniref:M48 family metallopeptidase n=1 Tax=Ferrimonas aestuarii TaxID=2569539 RepID=A0A4V5NVV7_9GAMM|nr:YgjP-like metallopeptidase domain-containing protein [Ferrimonas aestuarii]TKB52758.1 M48 family metallopeptidase [Ferrimonas aestuarii]